VRNVMLLDFMFMISEVPTVINMLKRFVCETV